MLPNLLVGLLFCVQNFTEITTLGEKGSNALLGKMVLDTMPDYIAYFFVHFSFKVALFFVHICYLCKNVSL